MGGQEKMTGWVWEERRRQQAGCGRAGKDNRLGVKGQEKTTDWVWEGRRRRQTGRGRAGEDDSHPPRASPSRPPGWRSPAAG